MIRLISKTGVLWVVSSVMLLAGITACGSGGSTVPDIQKSPAEFKLEILDETFMENGAADGFTITTVVEGDEVVLSIAVAGAVNLKALYCGISYDPEFYTPVSVRSTGNLDPDGGDIVEPDDLLRKDNGRVDHAQLLPWPGERDGYTGDAILAVARFRLEADVWNRSASMMPPLNRRSQASLNWDEATCELAWFETLSGDTNRDGYVTAGDLTAIGVYWKNSTGGGPFPDNDRRCMVDYDSNGEINSVDIYPLMRNYDCSIAGYHIFTSPDQADYPPTYADPDGSGTVMIGSVYYSEGSYITESVRKHFTFTVDDPLTDAYYWVRPVTYDEVGTPSTLAW